MKNLPRPRAATSVARRIGVLPVLNSEKKTSYYHKHESSSFENLTIQDPITLSLVLVTMDAQCRPAVSSHPLGQIISLSLRFREDDGLAFRLIHDVIEHLHHPCLLAVLVHDLYDLKTNR